VLGFLARASDEEVGGRRVELRFELEGMGVRLSLSRFSRCCRPGDLDLERAEAALYLVRATDRSDSFVATIRSSRSGNSIVSFPADEDKETY
jgi:hypothetical protein